MVDPLLSLTYLTLVIIIGLISSIISARIKIPNVLLLLLGGILLNYITIGGNPIVQFSTSFITAISILALIMIVFDSTSRLSFKEFDESSSSALKLTGWFVALTIVLLTTATSFLIEVPISLALLFSTLMVGTAPDVVLSIAQDSKNRIMQILKIESIVNTPLVVLIPFIILDFMKTIETQEVVVVATDYFKPFLLQIFTGAGVGLIISIIVFKVMRRYYSENLSPLAVISTALLSYILAENLGGNGVLSVTVAGLMFANFTIKQKVALMSFSKLFSAILEILVFIFVGLLIRLPSDYIFWFKSIILFFIYLVIRYIAVYLSLRGETNLKERLFMTFNMPKGIAVAVVTALLINFNLPKTILDLTFIFMLYSILSSTIIMHFSKYFVKVKVIK